MAIASSVSNYLTGKGCDYHVVPHRFTQNSASSAHAAHVEPSCVAKAIVIATITEPRQYRVAVVPASRDIDIVELEEVLGEDLELAEERELRELFPDCVLGAVPVLGAAYDLPTVVDDVLDTCEEIYFEAGDHTELIRVSGEQFQRLMANAIFGQFSYVAPRDEFRR